MPLFRRSSSNSQLRITLLISIIHYSLITHNLMKHKQIQSFSIHCCRVELCSAAGTALRDFTFEECEGGPHETRGMRRSTLLRALADAMPADGIRFGAAIADVAERPDGVHFLGF